MALLGTVLVAALVLGLAAWGVIDMAGNSQKTVYNETTANQARTAALVGIQAATAYVQSVYAGSNPPSSASLANLDTALLQSGSGLLNQGLSQINNANVQEMVVANTFSSTTSSVSSANGATGSLTNLASGYIRMLSTGRSGGAVQTADTYLTAQLNNLDKYNANLILGPNSTFNGNLNKGGIPIIVVASTESTAQSAGITLNGTTNYTYLPISQFPVINANEFAQYATIQLGGDGEITVPPSAESFYESLYPSGYLTTLNSIFSYDSASNTWTMKDPPPPASSVQYTPPIVPGLIYVGSTTSPSNPININIVSGASQTTVVATGTITVSGNVTMSPFAAITSPNTNYCSTNSTLPICVPGSNPPTSYTNLQGLVLLSSGSILYANGSQGSSFAGDVVTAGSLNLNGGGTYSFGGTIVAVNGVQSSNGQGSGSSTVNGAITLTSPVAAANSATLGGYQLTPTSLRWLP
jgi:hypothetical protein